MRTKGSQKRRREWLNDFLANRALLTRVVARFVRPHDIEDIVQETFVRSYAASRKHAIRNPRAFMLKTAKNLAINSVSRSNWNLQFSIDDFPESYALSGSETPESLYEAEQEFLTFCQAVAELPVACRRVFIMKKVYGLTLKEIAAHLGISQSTVENHITRGMMMTAQFMLDNGYGGSTHIGGSGLHSAEEEQEL